MTVVQTYKALGDVTRLKMVERLSKHSNLTVGSLSEGLGITRQGARKHLVVLEEARLVRLVSEGRETKVFLNAPSLTKAKAFIADLEMQWDVRLEALRVFTEQ